jgi:hypothetical protein
MRKYPITVRIAEVRRELALRKAVYPGQVTRGKMRQSEADRHLDIMQDVHDTLVWLQENEQKLTAMLA